MLRRPAQEGPLVKVRVRLADAKVLGAFGYAPGERVASEHEDTWFERPEGPMLGSIVLRRPIPAGPWSMAWETTIRTGPNAERHLLWTAVDGPRMQATLRRLGMQPVLTLRSQRIPLERKQRRIALERVQDVGDFLEVPGPDRKGRWATDVAQLLRDVGAATRVHSYRELARPAAT